MSSQLGGFTKEKQTPVWFQTTLELLVQIADDIMRATNNGLLTALVLLDFSKTFDSIDHKVIVAVLSSVGLTKNATLLL